MRVFVTGATGFIGFAIVRELIDAGHQVTGLARSEDSARKLTAAGAQVCRGSIEDLDCLRSGAADADGAIHTAFYHAITHVDLAKRLRVILGGTPRGMVGRFVAAAVGTDRRALQTLGQELAGGNRPLVAAFATMAMKAGRLAVEDEAYDPDSVGGARGASEDTMHSLTSLGVRTSVVRLPPVVHDRDKQGLVTLMIATAKKKGVSAYVGEGQNRWGAVHRLDAARLFRLALEKSSAGATYHGVAEEGVPVRRIAESIGRQLNIPVVSKSKDDAAKLFSWMAPFVSTDNPVSSKLTQERLGWRLTGQPGMIADLDNMSYS